MDLTVYLNGEFIKADQARVSIYDHSFLYGDNVFETMRVYHKHIFKFHEHMDRFFESARQIYLEVPLIRSVIEKAVKILLDQNALNDAVVRVMLSRGEGAIGIDLQHCPKPTFLITAYPAREIPSKKYEQGVHLVLSPYRRVPQECLDSSIKSGNYMTMILAREEAKKRGADEALLLNLEGYITECTTSNIFIVKDGRLLTPDLNCGVLSGVTRKNVMDLAVQTGKEVFETFLAPEDVIHADECFISNSIFEIMPVTRFERKSIAHGRPGKVTTHLMNEYRSLIAESCKEEEVID